MPKTYGPSFDVTKAQAELIDKIAERAVKVAKEYNVPYRKQDALMDLTACVANNDFTMDLGGLLTADGFNFNHDVFGIRRHINRETGKLMDCFLPRCARF